MRTCTNLLVVLFYISLYPSLAKAESEERERSNVLLSLDLGGMGGSADYSIIPEDLRRFSGYNSFSDRSNFLSISLGLNLLINFWNHPQRFWLNGIFTRVGIGGNLIYKNSSYPNPTRQPSTHPGESYNFFQINPGIYFYLTVGIYLLSVESAFFISLEAGYLATQLVLIRGYDTWGRNSLVGIASLGLSHGGTIALSILIRPNRPRISYGAEIKLIPFFTEDMIGLSINLEVGINFSRQRNTEEEESTSRPTE